METFVRMVPFASSSLAGALLASVWQGLLLTTAVAAAMYRLRSVPPSARTWVWRVVLLLMFASPVLAVLLPHGGAGDHRGLRVGQGWSAALLAAWAVCSLWRGAALATEAIGLRHVVRRAVPVVPGDEWSGLLRGAPRAELCVSAEVNRPCVTGLRHPRILLPQGLLETLSEAEVGHVVRHEMEHLRRGDHWFNLLQQLGLILFPLNPALVWLDRRLCRERELACDDGVLRATHGGRAYAACLVKLAEDSMQRKGLRLAMSALGSGLGLGLVGGARESELMQRVRRILAGPDRASVTGVRVRLGLTALTAAAAAGTVMLAGSPRWIRFEDPAPVQAQGDAPSGIGIAAQMRPVSVALDGRMVRPVMRNVVMEQPRRVSLRAAAGHPNPNRRRLRARMLPVSTVSTAPRALAPRAWAMRPVEASTGVAAAQEMRPAVWSADGAAQRVAVTEFEVSQPMYAAVPWGGGWLIVQL